MEYIYLFCNVLHKSVTKMSVLCTICLVSASFCDLSLQCLEQLCILFALIFFINYSVANTCRYSNTKKCGIEPKIKAEINYYYNFIHQKNIFHIHFYFLLNIFHIHFYFLLYYWLCC